MLQLLGPQALSAFRMQQLLREVQALQPAILGMSAQRVYFVDIDCSLTEQQTQLLWYLLQPLQEGLPSALPHQPVMTVVPRVGTVSPWSSKATHIAHNCGLAVVLRIEQGIVYQFTFNTVEPTPAVAAAVVSLLYDPLTQTACQNPTQLADLFAKHTAAPLGWIDYLTAGEAALHQANTQLGLALNEEEIAYLAAHYRQWQRNPTDVELMMFAQANSEHCRHKIFNAHWTLAGIEQPLSLFDMIKHTYATHSEGVLSAYKDNAAVIAGAMGERFFIHPQTKQYQAVKEPIHFLIKVETHNHPTAISPYPGAATGSGGEIRDEGATGRGAKPKAGLTGFSVSNLRLPGLVHPWEQPYGKPAHLSSPLEIMIKAPIGAAAFNNEFGRPSICGYFRTFEQRVDNAVRGYHKPIMLAGGLGNIRPNDVQKRQAPAGALVIVLGGPAMQIGLGGGAASSMAAGDSSEALDFASVQRDNAEMQRRCQEVIDHCWSLGDANPLISIHDVGAGGLSNALPELVHDSGRGGVFELRHIPNAEPGMSPVAIWCNEAQERYVLTLLPDDLTAFSQVAERERCPFAVVGTMTASLQLQVNDELLSNRPIDMPLSVLLGKPPKMQRNAQFQAHQAPLLNTAQIDLEQAVWRVLHLPVVAAKNFLITIGDRTVTGLIARDQMVGPWQVPVADVGVTLGDYQGYQGEAMAIGERSPVALLNPQAAGRLCVGEAITNIAAAAIAKLSDVKLSANWMAACGFSGEDAALYETVKAVAYELCPQLGLTIPVGKDSLSMRTAWREEGQEYAVTSPLSLIISAFAPVVDARTTLTPLLHRDEEATLLLLIDLGQGKNRLGASALGEVYQCLGGQTPDLDSPLLLAHFFAAMGALKQADYVLAYHDRSDGGLLACLAEMAFASHCGLTIRLDALGADPVAALFAEELGAVIQIREKALPQVLAIMADYDLAKHCHPLGCPNGDDLLYFHHQDQVICQGARYQWQQWWTETSYRLQALRDNPVCAEEEFAHLQQTSDPGLPAALSFNLEENIAAPFIAGGVRPKVMILREQGVNGHLEMAAAFDRAGFSAIDVHMSDILAERVDLAAFKGMAACGGFSYGDVLGAGKGWAQTILLNPRARDAFRAFFNRPDTFTLGVCNGCQMLAQLRSLIPGAQGWPDFVRNVSEQYESRLVAVQIVPSPSLFFAGMAGSQLPIVVAHGEGQAVWENPQSAALAIDNQLVALQYIDNEGTVTQQYPANPNGSPLGMTGFSSQDGRALILMPHPERVFRAVQFSWHPKHWTEASPWLRVFQNARRWVG